MQLSVFGDPRPRRHEPLVWGKDALGRYVTTVGLSVQRTAPVRDHWPQLTVGARSVSLYDDGNFNALPSAGRFRVEGVVPGSGDRFLRSR